MTEKRQYKWFHMQMLALLLTVFCWAVPVSAAGPVIADAPPVATVATDPPRYGYSAEFANTYDPHTDISFLLFTGFATFDYGSVWRQDRPKELRFKVEGAAGATVRPDVRTVASVNMFALYYLDKVVASDSLRPYFEAGIGGIYTDFRVRGQGLRFNFNPILGLGTDFKGQGGDKTFLALRLHHLSNAELNRENRGVNSLVLQVGRYF